MSDAIKLSVVIPSYNEAENFKNGALEKVSEYLASQPYAWEVIIVDDGSNDDSPGLIENWIKTKQHFTLIKNQHQGKGPAVKTGVLKSQGELVLFTDFDQATPISEIEKLFPFLEKGYQIAIGSREVKGSKREKEPFYRHLMGRGWNLIVKMLAIGGIHDTQCGFKLFTSSAAKELFTHLEVYKNGKEEKAFTGAFDVEILYIAQKWGLKLAEVPVYWTYVKTDRVNPVRDSVRMFSDLLKIKLADLQGKYNARQ